MDWDRYCLPPEFISSLGTPAEPTPPWGNIATVLESITDSLSLSSWQELADFLSSGILTYNGIRSGETRTQFDGLEDVAVRCLCFLKRSKDEGKTPAFQHATGGVYITAKGAEQTTEELATER